MQPYIPFYKSTLDTAIFHKLYDTVASDKFPVQVARKMFLHKNYDDSIWTIVKNSALRKQR